MRVAVDGGTEHLLYNHGFLESKAITMKINFSKCTWVFSLFAMTLFVSQAVMAQDEGEGRTVHQQHGHRRLLHRFRHEDLGPHHP